MAVAQPPSPGDVQRLFLQAVLSRRVLSGDLAKVLWRKCIDAVKGVDPAILEIRNLSH
jgi:non-structural maintenance of chromosomes element 1